MDVGGGGGVAPLTFSVKIMENFGSFFENFSIFNSSIQVFKIQHFRKCIYILGICMLIIRS